MSSARRPLLTATAAGTLLCALWFVPSAHASQDAPARTSTSEGAATQVTQQARALSEATSEATGDASRLADTGSPNTTPYVVGGSLFLAVGAGFVVYSVRRERLEF
ncbi:LAETG motif-containing sortase-dependent surface protein [Streptomyces sp. NPDC013172]|uniref:LAETG motif-containing sortase-dependent surface protein n=1 Tax=Streptomyces sp. NPDC013172 TaxID=3155009 RepID=UPI00340C452A